jgi:hypothetical protein
VNWETGESTYEPLDVIQADDPVTCAAYAKHQGLQDTPGWKQFKWLATREKNFQRPVNQARLHSARHSPVFKFGYQLPRDHKQAVAVDKLNGNSKWQEAEKVEMSHIH